MRQIAVLMLIMTMGVKNRRWDMSIMRPKIHEGKTDYYNNNVLYLAHIKVVVCTSPIYFASLGTTVKDTRMKAKCLKNW